MIALNHVLAGTAIGLVVKRPELAAPLAFLSHFLLDITPHFSYEWPKVKFITIWTLDAIGSILALAFVSMAAPEVAWAVIAGGIFAELPDVIWVYERLILKAESKNWFFVFHRVIQWSQTKRGLWYELGYLAVLIVLNIILLLQQ